MSYIAQFWPDGAAESLKSTMGEVVAAVSKMLTRWQQKKGDFARKMIFVGVTCCLMHDYWFLKI